MPKLTQTSSSLKLLLLRKWGDECREELSQPRIKPAEPFLILLDMTGKASAKALHRNGLQHILLPACLPLTGNSCAPMLEGIRSLLIVSPNHGENKESHCQEPCFPPNTVEEHIKFTVPYHGTAVNISQEQRRRQEHASLGLFVFLSHLENWSVARATQGLNIRE